MGIEFTYGEQLICGNNNTYLEGAVVIGEGNIAIHIQGANPAENDIWWVAFQETLSPKKPGDIIPTDEIKILQENLKSKNSDVIFLGFMSQESVDVVIDALIKLKEKIQNNNEGTSEKCNTVSKD